MRFELAAEYRNGIWTGSWISKWMSKWIGNWQPQLATGKRHLNIQITLEWFPKLLNPANPAATTLNRSRPKRNSRKPPKFCTPSSTPSKQACSNDDLGNVTPIDWEEDDLCCICESMGEDDDLVSWILCSFCEQSGWVIRKEVPPNILGTPKYRGTPRTQWGKGTPNKR